MQQIPKMSNLNSNGFVNNAFHQPGVNSTSHINPQSNSNQTPHTQTQTIQPNIQENHINHESHTFDTNPTININRPSFNQPAFYIYAQYDKPTIPLKTQIKNTIKDKIVCNSNCLKQAFLRFFPFLTIFRGYKLSDFLNDLIAGLTVGIINIPQGMAYGMLANLPPVYGLYTSFFPVIIYFFFGTSKHISMGTFALISLMVGVVVNKADCEKLEGQINNVSFTSDNTTGATINPVVQCQLDYAVATTFLAGLFQIIFAILRFDILTEYLSGPITRALTTGAAFHIFTSQLRHVFGYSLGHFTGFLQLIKKYIQFFISLKQTNVASLVTAFICLVLIYLNKRFVNPKIKKYIKMPFPIEFILLIVVTGLSYAFKFSSPDVFNMTVVGDVPRGFPLPSVPKFYLLSHVVTDALVIAIIAFIISFSMARLYSEMEKYKIDSNQELYAYGLSAMISSFFNCFMPAASLSRSNVQYYGGCKTQMTGLVSCVLLLVVILAVGPLFYSLPNCVLAAIIIVNLKNTFLQFTDLSYLFKISILDGFTWLITCTMVVLSNVDVGLGVGVAFSLYSIVLRTQRPKVKSLGNVEGTELYEDIRHFARSKELNKIKIIRLTASLYYANVSYFSEKLAYENVLGSEDLKNIEDNKILINMTVEVDGQEQPCPAEYILNTSDLVIDCSLVSFIDSDGIVALNKAFNDYKGIGIKVHLASCNEKLTRIVYKAHELGKLQCIQIFVTVHDAVTSIESVFVTKL